MSTVNENRTKLTNVRIAFLTLFEPKKVAGNADSEARFSAAFVIEPGSANAKALKARVEAVAKEKWGAKAAAILADLRAKDRVCYKEGPLSKDGAPYEGFEGKHAINASNKVRPLILDRSKDPETGELRRLTAKDGRPYGGCFVNATVELWAQDNQFGKRINASLKGVQFVQDGDAFGGGAPASPDEFDEIPEDGAGALA